MFDCQTRDDEHDLDLPGNQVGYRRRSTAIRHVDHVDASHRFEQFAGDMCPVPMPADAMLILPGLVFAWAMNSGTDLAGTDGLTAMTVGGA